MTWIKIDDQFADHPKFVARSDTAIASWVRALAYSSRYLTDGIIPKAAQRLIGPDAAIDELVDAGLLIDLGDDWQIHDYTDHQRTRAEVEADRAASAERVRNYRKRQRNAVTPPSRNGVTHALVTDPESESELETDHHHARQPKLSTGPDDEVINQAIDLVVERRCHGKALKNPDAYRATVRNSVEHELRAKAADLLTRFRPPADILAAALDGERHSLARYRIATEGTQ